MARTLTLLLVAVAMSIASCFSTGQSSRAQFLKTVGRTSAAVLTLPNIARAKSGDSSNIIMPNYVEYLIEKNKQVDPSDLLYKGPDLELQLRRIGEAANRLPEIVSLAEDKKWSQVQGIITGPLGTLLQTLNSLASSANSKEVTKAAQQVKKDLLEIGVAAGRKESVPCVKAAENATKDLQKFVMLL